MATENTALLSINQRFQLAFGRNFFHRYKSRYSLNRYVALVLLWNWLIWFAVEVFTNGVDDTDLVSVVTTIHPYNYSTVKYLLQRVLPTVCLASSTIVSVWLAGWNYKLPSIVLAGMTILFLGLVFDAIVETASFSSGSTSDDQWVVALTVLAKIIIAIGTGPCLANIIQLTMEQIPGASNTQLSSIISWIIFSSTLGLWLHSFITGVYTHCANSTTNRAYLPLLKLGMVILMTPALATNYLCHDNLLDYSPASHSMKQVYHIVKYALTNKYPKNRTAGKSNSLSRLDNGKRKFGGPFTNEEVEEVKTFLQISVLCLATFVYLTILYLNGYSLSFFDHGNYNHSLDFSKNSWDNCTTFIAFSFTAQNTWWLLIFILIYELIFVPVFYLKMPGMLFRVGIAAFIAAIIGVVQTVFLLIDYYSGADQTINPFGPKIGLAMGIGLCRAIYYTSGLEFICAQSPYAMRNIFITAVYFIIILSPGVSGLIFTLWKHKCVHPSCAVIYTVLMISLGLLALIIYCIFVKCYRKRSRDDEESNSYDDTISIT